MSAKAPEPGPGPPDAEGPPGLGKRSYGDVIGSRDGGLMSGLSGVAIFLCKNTNYYFFYYRIF